MPMASVFIVEDDQQIRELTVRALAHAGHVVRSEEYLEMSMLCGDEAHIRQRIQLYKDIGVTHLNITPTGDNPLNTIEMMKAWVE